MRQERHLRTSKKGRIFPAGHRKKMSVFQVANIIKTALETSCQRITIAGSIRRKAPNPNDIDIVIIPEPGKLDLIKQKFDLLTTPTMYGNKKMSGKAQGYQVDLFFATPQDYESQLMFATGPVGANIWHRTQAKRKGWLLNQYGLFDKKGMRIASTEKGIYQALGLSYRPPELRGLPRTKSIFENKKLRRAVAEEKLEKNKTNNTWCSAKDVGCVTCPNQCEYGKKKYPQVKK